MPNTKAAIEKADAILEEADSPSVTYLSNLLHEIVEAFDILTPAARIAELCKAHGAAGLESLRHTLIRKARAAVDALS